MGLPQINESEFEKILVGLGHDGVKLIALGIWKLCWYVKLMKNLESDLGLIDTVNPLLKERLIIFSKCIDCYEEPKTLEHSLKLINDFFDFPKFFFKFWKLFYRSCNVL